MRFRIRDKPDLGYQVVHRSDLIRDHVHRALLTASTIALSLPETVCDPACGDGHILDIAYRLHPFGMTYLSDISAPAIAGLSPSFPHVKRVADIYEGIEASPLVDLIVLTESLEHMEDPDAILRLARKHARKLVASSPLIHESRTDTNPEHIWQWDAIGYQEMLEQAGWNPDTFAAFKVIPTYYEFQLWSAT